MDELRGTGMTCQHQVCAAKEAPPAVLGVVRVECVELDSGCAWIEGSVDTQALVAAVKVAGYGAEPVAA